MVSPSVSSQLTTKQRRVLSQERNLENLSEENYREKSSKSNESVQNLSLSGAQELICQYFLEQRKKYSSESVLQEFKHLFIEPTEAVDSTLRQALHFIVASGSEQTFIHTLKRSIYILVNNWSSARQETYIQQLVQLLSTPVNTQIRCTATFKRLMRWRRNFVNSQDYQELKLFASKYENRHQEHWSQRYSSYLLVSQAVDVKKPIEQQEAALTHSKQLKERFKFELAMYTARSSSTTCQECSSPNPTNLGDEVLHLIRQILEQQGQFSYASLARIFLKQTQQICYKDFKQSLLNYLFFALDDQNLAEAIKTQLAPQLNILYQTYDNQPWNSHLLLRTCKRLIEALTMSDRGKPSRLFVALVSQGKALVLARLLLKLVLLCPSAHTHLECCLAQLIGSYKSQSESECEWLINFLEVIQLTLTIYLENVRFNLVNMSEYQQEIAAKHEKNIYRIFSQENHQVKINKKAA